MKLKKGVKLFGLKYRMRAALKVCEAVYKNAGRKEGVTITSTTDGTHSAGSLHPYGYAFDTRTYYFSVTRKEFVFKEIKERLADISYKYDVVLEKDHIHIEWDKDKRRKA